MEMTSLMMCSYFRPINKEFLSNRHVFYLSVNSSFCCTFWH